MVCKCKACGGDVVFQPGDTAGVCGACGARQEIDASVLYEEAGVLVQADTEESLEQAMALYKSIPGWQDADKQLAACRTRLGQLRWKVESAWLKEQEERFEAKVTRWKRIALFLLAAVLLVLAVVTTVSLIRFRQYNKAAAYFTAGEYDRSAAAFQAMGDYMDSRARVYTSAVELYKAKRYEEALPYFVWLNGYPDHGYFLQRCQERLADGK